MTVATDYNGDHRCQRRRELLADRTIWGLSAAETAELEPLLAEAPGEADEFERAAAAVTAAMLPAAEVPPLGLLLKLEADARRHFGHDTAAMPWPAPAPRRRRAAPGLVAAAAAVLTSGLWWWAQRPTTTASLREELVALPGSVHVAWQPGPSPRSGAVRGDVVWHAGRQQGVLSLRGLPANDPAEHRFQLWVVDGGRDAPEPIDGGVFDVDGDETVVAFKTKLPVVDARAFVVTIERPEGVVVSRQEHVVASARAD